LIIAFFLSEDDGVGSSNRWRAYLRVTGIYLLALAAAIAVVIVMDSDLWKEILAADVVATLVVFVGSAAMRNSSVYDAYWSVAPAVVAIGLLVVESGNIARRLILTVVVLVWAVRLTANWAYGWEGFQTEDWRYRKLQADTGRFYWAVSFAGIHLFPTLMVFAGMLPMLVAYRSERSLNVYDLLGVVIGFSATALEGIADAQMHRFRRSNTDSTIVMAQGLWSRSRHPNYLGEILFWVGVAWFGVAGDPGAWWQLVGVLTMIGLFVGISIPMIEKRHLERKGDAYVKYSDSTPMLVPRRR
jgi:steroid 5-alpha reductase family enzyme